MPKKKTFTSEVDLARGVKEWLESQGYDVYQEVGLFRSVADLVAIQGQKIVIVEAKLSLGLRVIEQAVNWRRYAHLVYAATPFSTRRRDDQFVYHVAATYGIGLLTVRKIPDFHTPGQFTYQVEETQASPFNRKIRSDYVRLHLNEAQKTWAEAGNNRGQRWTPFQQTCRNLQEFVQRQPGCTIKDAIDGIKHHYGTPATARAVMVRYIQTGIVHGLRLERQGQKWLLFPK